MTSKCIQIFNCDFIVFQTYCGNTQRIASSIKLNRFEIGNTILSKQVYRAIFIGDVFKLHQRESVSHFSHSIRLNES